MATPAAAADVEMRAQARARGTDRPAAIAVGRAILAQPLAAQLTQIRCEKMGRHRICGLVLSGLKFKHPLGRSGFLSEVAGAIRTAFASAPLEEVDLWATVPLDAGHGAAVSGDAAVPTAATVFAVSVPHPALARLDDQLASGRDVFWDATFADLLAKERPQ